MGAWSSGALPVARRSGRGQGASSKETTDSLLIATGTSGPFAGPVLGLIGGLKELVGGKILDYALPEIAGQFRPTCLFRSKDGSLWIGTMQGLLHLHQGRIDGFSVTDGLSGNFVRNVFGDREGNVWVCTENGLDRFRELAAPTISVNQGLSTSALTCWKRPRMEVSGLSRRMGRIAGKTGI